MPVTSNGDLSKQCVQKLMTLTPTLEKCPMDFYRGVVFTAQLW